MPEIEGARTNSWAKKKRQREKNAYTFAANNIQIDSRMQTKQEPYDG